MEFGVSEHPGPQGLGRGWSGQPSWRSAIGWLGRAAFLSALMLVIVLLSRRIVGAFQMPLTVTELVSAAFASAGFVLMVGRMMRYDVRRRWSTRRTVPRRLGHCWCCSRRR